MSLDPAFFTSVHNRGKPSQDFMDRLTRWVREAPAEVFSETYKGREADIYDSIRDRRPELSRYGRRALMGEVLRVLAGFESSWNWREGRDVTNPSSNTPATEEAGAFQCSANSCNFDKSLVDLFNVWAARTGKPYWTNMTASGRTFIEMTKGYPDYAMEHAARLLRFTVRHHGPVVRGEIFPWMRVPAIEAFEDLTATVSPPEPGAEDLRLTVAKAAMVASDLVDLLGGESAV